MATTYIAALPAGVVIGSTERHAHRQFIRDSSEIHPQLFVFRQEQPDAGVAMRRERRDTMATIGNDSNQPNLFELTGDEYTQITYSTTSITGQPQFHYQDKQRDLNFTGDDIRLLDTDEVGTLVSVTLEVIPDLHTLTLSVLIPQINLKGETERPLSTLAILTTHLTSIGGPGLVEGPLLTYEMVALEGTARLVEF
jgi:hypothetical protein